MIRLNDFGAEPEDLKAEVLKASERVIRSGYFILGPEVDTFEREWATKSKVNYCVGVANGLDAIEIGLRGLGIGPGDEVVTTTMTAVATVLGIIRSGATPVLADIDPETGLIDIASVERCLTKRTKAILIVYLFGQMPNMDPWIQLCNRENIYLLEDCAQAHLAEDQGKVAGSIGDFGAYSFYPTKNLGALGDAGALVTMHEGLAAKAKQLRNYGQSNRYVHELIGLNSRLDELQAAILSVRLRWLREFTEKRQYFASLYHNNILNPRVRNLKLPVSKANHVYHLFVVKSYDRDVVTASLKSKGIETLIHYPIPVHKQTPLHGVKRDPFGLLNAETFANECFSIPCGPQLELKHIDIVVDAINSLT